jgi:hypothetical protein
MPLPVYANPSNYVVAQSSSFAAVLLRAGGHRPEMIVTEEVPRALERAGWRAKVLMR